MKRLKFTFSPVFILFALVMLALSDAVLFAVYIASVLLHEYAHYLAALKFGLCMDEVKLYPFGAVLYGEMSHLSLHEEIIVALAGPLLNIVIALLFVASWWIVPDIYIYTDTLMMANVSIAMFNLLPVYPLDGGRIALNLLLKKMQPKKAFRLLYICSITFAGALFAAYFVTSFLTINYTLGIAAILIFSGAFDMGNELIFRKTYCANFTEKRLQQGLPVKHIAVKKDITLFKLMSMLSSNCYYTVYLLDDEYRVKKTLPHSELNALVCGSDLYTPLDELLGI
ncbi:MAG: hypothetical protein EOM87_09065 [Clostridia bacterium]|nr:hypothetical protein [Clostridia bacterium]